MPNSAIDNQSIAEAFTYLRVNIDSRARQTTLEPQQRHLFRVQESKLAGVTRADHISHPAHPQTKC